MQRQPLMNSHRDSSLSREINLTRSPGMPQNLSRGSSPTTEDARLASLKVLAHTLLNQVESLETLFADDGSTQLNLHDEVQRFEAAIIRSALLKTGGRQRRAARLLGVKVTTLNTKIKRLRIKTDSSTEPSSDSLAPINELLPPA